MSIRPDSLQLVALFNEINLAHFAGALPLPQLQWNTRLRSSAGRFIPGSRPSARGVMAALLLGSSEVLKRDPVIEVASYLLEIPDGDKHVRDTIAHEMIHYWLWHRRRPYGHSAEFHAKMRVMGVSRYNPVPKLKPHKYIYRCPACEKDFPARRRLGRVACLSCCKRFSAGRFDARFALKLTTQIQE